MSIIFSVLNYYCCIFLEYFGGFKVLFKNYIEEVFRIVVFYWLGKLVFWKLCVYYLCFYLYVMFGNIVDILLFIIMRFVIIIDSVSGLFVIL